MQSVMELRNVRHIYPNGTVALDNISLTIEPGRKIAVLGNNGAGKSSLLLHLNGLLKPHKGEVYFQGHLLTYKSKELKELRQRVGIMFQNPEAQLFSPTILADVMYGPLNLGWPRREAERSARQALAAAGLEELRDQPPHFLSLGQKKRAAMAGVMVMKPQLLLLDEPTAGLDPYYAKKMIKQLTDFQEGKQTIVLSTHDVNLAYEWADEIIMMNKGRLMLKDKPQHAFGNQELLATCHLEPPWVIEVYHQWKKTRPERETRIPKTKEELFQLLQEGEAERPFTANA
ncbi:energy-coupling factor ABC transporter ATP-binding protein [Bacillus xiapuensis]|uniref:energy-coupling factor ABC transporter ATP-binding protein n=1 Tax=Bacillus xiapuensis TaxID=2014075 RepID=UPI000C2477D7|nr:ABC transporter ATP-binding protein [Bacillus xiapuensis]